MELDLFHISSCLYVLTLESEPEEGIGYPGSGIVGGCVPLNVGTGI